jgi:hypothetical protein
MDGVPALKYPSDSWSYQEIVYETKPDLIIETGTNEGGSASSLSPCLTLYAPVESRRSILKRKQVGHFARESIISVGPAYLMRFSNPSSN